MRFFVLLFCLFLSTPILKAQGSREGFVVVNLSKSENQDIKCDKTIMTLPNYQIDDLIKEGRYVIATVYTKFGCLIVHKPNTESIPQVFKYVPAFDLKKTLKDMFNDGYSLKYYNPQRNYAIFDKNPKITIQKYETSIGKKKMEDFNSKGLYVMLLNQDNAVVQNGHTGKGGVVMQKFKEFYGNNAEIEMLTDYLEYEKKGWRVGSVSSSYFNHSDYNSYCIIYDKYSNEDDSPKEYLGIIDTQDELAKFITDYNASGYKLANIWCGFKDNSGEKGKRYSSTESSGLFDILGGIVNGVSKLSSGNVTDAPVQNNISTSDEPIYSDSSPSSSGSSSSKTTKVNHANWKSLDNSYNGYEDQLIRIQSSGSINKQEVRNIQNKMKEIRKKIFEQSGHQRAVSKWENWNP